MSRDADWGWNGPHACCVWGKAIVLGETKEEKEERARLYSAAPDLLEALEELVNEVDASREGAPNSVGVALLNSSVVIAKARGAS